MKCPKCGGESLISDEDVLGLVREATQVSQILFAAALAEPIHRLGCPEAVGLMEEVRDE